MKNLFTSNNINCAQFYTLTSENNINNLRNIKFPVIANPACGIGTFNTKKLCTIDELRDYYCNIDFHPAIVSKHITIEEFIDGETCS